MEDLKVVAHNSFVTFHLKTTELFRIHVMILYQDCVQGKKYEMQFRSQRQNIKHVTFPRHVFFLHENYITSQ